MLQQLALSIKNRKGKKIKKEDDGGNLGSYTRVCFPKGFGRTGCLDARVILLSMIHLSPLITCL
ncbi:unnamed protein product [Coffea canephora]|uniref:Uncharacterized protein n=1 Tax=Coffea canephora TaxID=49390 RepID=A0A068U019_COFCA|nr:unnamed protein product [Coffea canephora]